jgi:hypothetical protein
MSRRDGERSFKAPPLALAAALGLGLAAAGCGAGSESGSGAATEVQRAGASAEKRGLEEKPGAERTVEESDVYKLEGGVLYVQTRTGGLSAIDVGDPANPFLAASLPSLTGEAGEIFVHGASLLVVFRSTDPPCTMSGGAAASLPVERCEVTAVLNARSAPTAAGSLCLAGRLLASRLLGDRLILVTVGWASSGPWTRLYAIDVSNPIALVLEDELALAGIGHEVHVTSRAAYVAQALFGDPQRGTEVRYVDLADPADPLLERGSIRLAGAPQGRFHMEEAGTLGAGGMVVVPYTDQMQTSAGCRPEHYVQLVDLEPQALIERGRIQQAGRVLRAVPIGSRLYSVSERTVASVDVTSRSSPFAASTVVVGDLAARDACEPVFLEQPTVVTVDGGAGPVAWGCRAAGPGATGAGGVAAARGAPRGAPRGAAAARRLVDRFRSKETSKECRNGGSQEELKWSISAVDFLHSLLPAFLRVFSTQVREA